MDIRGLIADNMGHFSARDVPNVVFVLCMAVLLGFLVARFGARSSGASARRYAMWCGAAALATALVRSQLPIAVLVLAAAALVGRREGPGGDGVVFFITLTLGVGCGSGAAVVVTLVAIPAVVLMRWALARSSDAL